MGLVCSIPASEDLGAAALLCFLGGHLCLDLSVVSLVELPHWTSRKICALSALVKPGACGQPP